MANSGRGRKSDFVFQLKGFHDCVSLLDQGSRDILLEPSPIARKRDRQTTKVVKNLTLIVRTALAYKAEVNSPAYAQIIASDVGISMAARHPERIEQILRFYVNARQYRTEITQFKKSKHSILTKLFEELLQLKASYPMYVGNNPDDLNRLREGWRSLLASPISIDLCVDLCNVELVKSFQQKHPDSALHDLSALMETGRSPIELGWLSEGPIPGFLAHMNVEGDKAETQAVISTAKHALESGDSKPNKAPNKRQRLNPVDFKQEKSPERLHQSDPYAVYANDTDQPGMEAGITRNMLVPETHGARAKHIPASNTADSSRVASLVSNNNVHPASSAPTTRPDNETSNRGLSEKDKTVKRLETALEEHVNLINNKDTFIKHVEKSLKLKDAIIQKQDSVIETLRATITERDDTIEQRNDKISRLEMTNNKALELEQELKKDLEDQSKVIKSKNAIIKQKLANIATKDKKTNKRKQQLAAGGNNSDNTRLKGLEKKVAKLERGMKASR
ncbi:hypothetical protein AB5N19_00132 [Seiridium cardinale]